MYKTLKCILLTLAVSCFAFFLYIPSVHAESVSVTCAGNSSSPTAVTEADLAGDDVTFTDGGDGWCVLNEAISAASVVINSGVTLTHVVTDVDGITISTTGIFSLAAGAYLNVNDKGSAGGSGGCFSGVDGFGTGHGHATGVYGIGGSGAGYGGLGGNNTSTGAGGSVYGDATSPVGLGSGGGGGSSGSCVLASGGNGGGLVNLNIGTILTLNGDISANGSSGSVGTNNISGGGGSGGGVKIVTTTLEGSGIITANGGSSTTNGGGGGGGRIAIYYDVLNGFTISNTTITSNPGTSGTASAGSAGSTFILDRKTDDGSGTVSITSGLDLVDGKDYSRSSFVLYHGAKMNCGAANYSTLNFSATGTISFDDVSWSCSTVSTVNIAANAWTFSGTNTMSNTRAASKTDWDIATDLTLTNFTYTGSSSPATDADGAITMDNTINVSLINSDINSNINWTNLISLNVDVDSSLNANNKGYAGGLNEGRDGSGTGHGHQSGSYNQGGGGAGYGGTGGNGSSGAAGVTYGDATNPIIPGSGGGTGLDTFGTDNDMSGGAGGGLIQLDVDGVLTLNGPVSANGENGHSTADANGGGGSGGGIKILTMSLAGTTGTITASGGNGGVDGGGGGGGRIRIVYGSDSSSYFAGLTASNATAAGTGVNNGAIGTFSSAQVVSLSSSVITDNSGYTNDTTPVITLTQSGATPTHVAFSCNAGSNWSAWIAYPDDNVLNDDDGPAFDMTSGATGCSVTNETKTISTKIKNADSESSVVTDTTTYDSVAPSVLNVTSPQANTIYGAGETLTMTVQFNDTTMAVSGSPRLELDMDGTDRLAIYSSTTTDTLSFTYTIVTGDNKADLDYVGTGSLTLNGGTITDQAGNVAVLTLAAPGGAGSLGANKDLVVRTNQNPTVASVTAVQGTDGTGDVVITFIMDDPDDDNTLQAKVEYSLNGGGSWADPTLSTTGSETSAAYGDPSINNAVTYQVGQAGAYITSSSGANTVSIVWEAGTDVPSSTDITNAKIRITPFDALVEGTPATSANFILDRVAPTSLAALTLGLSSTASSRLSWTPATDSHFNHYELWYATLQSDAENRTGAAVEWDDSDAVSLTTVSTANTTITGNLRSKYIRIFAVDAYGNEMNAATLYIPPTSDSGSASSANGGSTVKTYTITLTSPTAASGRLSPANPFTIQWSMGGTGTYSKVNLYLSQDGGTMFYPLATNLNADTGSYTWTPQGLTSSTLILRVDGTDLVNVLATDLSDVLAVLLPDVATPEDSTDATDDASQDSAQQSAAVEDVLGSRWQTDAEARGMGTMSSSFPSSVTPGMLIKLPDDGDASTQADSAVYYIGSDYRRHPFPNENVYSSWFTSFDDLHLVSSEAMASIPLGPMVTYKPGVTLIKFPTVPKVYAVDETGALRWIPTEDLARSLYGSNWTSLIRDVSDAFWSSYEIGEEVR